MHHLLAFYSSLAVSLTNAKLNAVEDGQYTIANSNFLLNERHIVQRAYCLSNGGIDARIVVPSMRAVTLPRVHPIDKNTAPANDPSVLRYRDNGPALLASEGVSMEMSTDATGTVASYGLLWVAPRFAEAPRGPVFTLKATASIVATVGTWGRGSMTLENDLPSGNYAVIGMDCQGANALAMRLRFPGGTMLPGVLAEQADGEFLTDHQRFGRMGLFGIFNSVQLPTLEVMAFGTTTTQTVYLDIVRVGGTV